MSMSDPIADLLVRVRNALLAGQPTVDMPASRIKQEICAVLKGEGYVKDYALLDAGAHKVLRIELKYLEDRSPVIQGLRRVSKPSLRVYAGRGDLRPVRSGLGISIVSTSRGVMTGKRARESNVGGEVLCEVW